MVNRLLLILPLLLILSPVTILQGADDPELNQTKALVDRLFMQASDGSIRFVDLVQPSKDSLAAMGDSAAKYLVFKLISRDARERHTLTDIYRKIGKAATPYLLAALDTEDKYQLRATARCLGEVKDSISITPLLEIINNDDYSLRSQVITSLGKIGGDDYLASRIEQYCRDSIEVVRKSSIVALKRITAERSLSVLFQALHDDDFSVRLTAYDAILKYKEFARENLLEQFLMADDNQIRVLLIRLAGELDAESTEGIIEQHLEDTNPILRGWAVWSWGKLKGKKAQKKINKMLAVEQDYFVKSQILTTKDYISSLDE